MTKSFLIFGLYLLILIFSESFMMAGKYGPQELNEKNDDYTIRKVPLYETTVFEVLDKKNNELFTIGKCAQSWILLRQKRIWRYNGNLNLEDETQRNEMIANMVKFYQSKI
ncbi:hypothetical protein Bealeia1_01014 [Candidatus Bealeia paramacronuclearis]|uniref:Uncharacterized protein n=1 Tax=Candidatus Bealeia paramacronuclearis TaxID=1921001 RepID=A0ABZ2C5W0_9PROT|nr:hypothetical protein [Candidatus Bealeia paramacronuclearis]